ncbi:MAG: sigma-54-dependent Fis family transcriptional regulator [Gemmatimonadetes bacterium]|nr:MAG: sigma-54-dependent Fis family transcriptional regulator [Gemmatimonadota bacterium]
MREKPFQRTPWHPTPDTRHLYAVSQTAPRILVADDQKDILEALKLLLKGEGYEVDTATSPRAVLSALDKRDFDALLIDMNYARDTTSGAEGLDLLARLQALDAPPPVVVMTAWASIDGAVEAMRRGARDFIEKPWDNRRLLATLRTHVELGRALRRSQQLERENRALRREGLPELIAESPAMQPVLKLMERIGPSDANVLVLGEHGTGKEIVARWLHAASARAERPLVAVNLGGIPDGLFESELFGHVKGAFTDAKVDRVGRFELAEGGTLFLDEIANLPLPQQAKLLRVLETGEFERVGSSKTQRVSVRVISATNADIPAEAAAGKFRQDLLFRLNTVEVRLPPLRERPEDVPLLASHFGRRHAARYRKRITGFAVDAMQALRAHPWPGNVRELDHAVERAVLLAEGDVIRARDLALGAPADGAAALEQMSLEEVERVLVQKALTRAGGNVSEAAKALGLSRSALYRRLKQHGF